MRTESNNKEFIYFVPPAIQEYTQKRINKMREIIPYNLGYKLTLPLSVHKSPLFAVKIKGQDESFSAIIDTGAVDIHVTRAFINRIDSVIFDVKREISASIGAEENEIHKIAFSIDGIDHQFTEEMTVMTGWYPYDIILGAHFLNQCKELHIYSREDKFTLII